MKSLIGKKILWVVVVDVVAVFLAFAANAGTMLIVDAPQPSDMIVVLAGETDGVRRSPFAFSIKAMPAAC